MVYKDKRLISCMYISYMESNEISEKIENPSFPYKIRVYKHF